MITATHATCPNCAGWGATGEPGSFLTCQVCSGTGVWLVDDSGHTFTYPFDTLVHPHSAQHFLLTKILRYTLVLGSVTLALACFAIILSQATTFTDVLWQGGWPHVGFGLAGLGSMAAFATFEKRRGSEKNLHNLSPDQNADLSDYAHSRLGELINEAGLIALSLHDDIITDSTFLAALIAHPRTQSMVARLEHVPDDVIDASKTFLAQGTARQVYVFTPSLKNASLLLFKKPSQTTSHTPIWKTYCWFIQKTLLGPKHFLNNSISIRKLFFPLPNGMPKTVSACGVGLFGKSVVE
jgi:hypothetical protein